MLAAPGPNKWGAALALALAVAAPEPARADTLSGQVLDSGGGAVGDALVTLRRQAVGFVHSTRTGGDGAFHLEAPGGAYELTAASEGFSVARQAVVLPRAGQLRLVLRPGAFTEEVTVVGTRVAGGAETLERVPGSVETLDKDTFEAGRVLNVNEALHKATGINVRDEEGFALRPNIGIRGLNPTRSAKALLLEDGVFVTYAPYGDNATYYHPPIERFSSLEVVKGAGQIAYGPVTVGGVLNYLTPAPPAEPAADLRLAAGNRGYLSGQARAGGTWGGTALLAEYMHKQGDGSRDHIHSRVDDASLKAVLAPSRAHTLVFKASYYGEGSDITYSGLTTAEYEQDPRQNPFVNDGFRGWRLGGSLKHSWLLGGQALLTTHAYGSRFSRDWWRQSSNSGQRPNDSADPRCAGMANLLTSCGNEGRLRDYDHFGVEPRFRFGGRLLGLKSELEAGVRAHFETQERLQVNGDTPRARAGSTVEDNRRANAAYSAFVQDRLLLGRVTLSLGVRFESIAYQRTNRLANGGRGASGRADLVQWVPGAGLSWSPSERLTVFGGVHRGFAPPRTEDVIGQAGGVVDLESEKSWNYEAGFRGVLARGVRVDGTAFVMDYENQIVAASLAGGVGATLTNGGATRHEGLELAARLDTGTLRGSPHNVFLRAAFTALPTARFEGTRTSNVAGFGTLSVSGNRLPYAPRTLFTGAVGYEHPRGLTAQLEVVYVGSQFTDDLNTPAPSADGQRGRMASYLVWNAALSYKLSRLSVFLTAKNLIDTLYVADRSRGAIPGPPRMVQAGVATRF